jgi:hypothetical protein
VAAPFISSARRRDRFLASTHGDAALLHLDFHAVKHGGATLLRLGFRTAAQIQGFHHAASFPGSRFGR